MVSINTVLKSVFKIQVALCMTPCWFVYSCRHFAGACRRKRRKGDGRCSSTHS